MSMMRQAAWLRSAWWIPLAADGRPLELADPRESPLYPVLGKRLELTHCCRARPLQVPLHIFGGKI